MDNRDKVVTLGSFIRACFIQAATSSWKRADLYSVLVGLVLGAVAYFIPAIEGRVTRLLLIVPLVSLASVTLFRLFLSPFLVYRNRDTEARGAENELRTMIKTQKETIRQKEEAIRTLSEKNRNGAGRSNNYDKLNKALAMFKETGQIALRYIRSVGTLKFGGMYSPTLPSGLTPEKALWVYRHCATEGLLTCTPNLGKTEETFSVPQQLDKIYDEVLFPAEGGTI